MGSVAWPYPSRAAHRRRSTTHDLGQPFKTRRPYNAYLTSPLSYFFNIRPYEAFTIP